MSPLLRRAAAAVLPLCLLASAAGAEEATPEPAAETVDTLLTGFPVAR